MDNKIKSLEEFFFQTPLYASQEISEENGVFDVIHNKNNNTPIDGYCCYCGRDSTFKIIGTNPSLGSTVPKNYNYKLYCSRDMQHTLEVFCTLVGGIEIMKIGQYPSLADISNSSLEKYRKSMSKIDQSEFYKANGLAAHGVGIGSFVYLRRVFERLIYSRFESLKEEKSWNQDDFYKKKMDEKVKFLRGFIPEFLSENSSIYSILSIGIHRLDESECIKYFNLLSSSIILILEDDAKKRKEEETRKEMTKLIANFEPPQSS